MEGDPPLGTWTPAAPNAATATEFPFLLQERTDFELTVAYADFPDGEGLELEPGVLLRKISDRTTAKCMWRANTFAVYTGVERGGLVHLDFGTGVGAVHKNDPSNIVNLSLASTSFIKKNFSLVHQPTEFVDVVAVPYHAPSRTRSGVTSHRPMDAGCKFRLSDALARHNRHMWMIGNGYLDRTRTTNTQRTRRKQSSDLTLAVSTLLLNFVELSVERQYRRPYAAGPYTDIDSEELRHVLVASLRRGQAIFTPNMIPLTSTQLRDIQDGRSIAEIPDTVLIGEGLEFHTDTEISVPPATDSGVFPYNSSYKLSTTSISYKNTIDLGIGQTQNKDADLSYATWTNGSLSAWGTRAECEKTLHAKWRQLPPTRDFLSRYINKEGAILKTGLWSYCGTRAHRKCYARTLLNNLHDNNDGVDYTKLEFDPNTAPTTTPPHGMAQFVLSQNGYMHLGNLDPRRNVEWYAMNEGVTPAILGAKSAQAAPDTAAIEDFTTNLRSMTKHVCDQDYERWTYKEVAAEFSVYWPFGMHSKTAQEAGRVYETRADLIMWGKNKETDTTNAMLIEYKTRMEVSDSVKDIYLLKTSTSDRLQLRLNTWMIYLNTGVFVPRAYVVQAARRTPDDTQDGTTAPSGVAVRLVKDGRSNDQTKWASPGMVRLITNFAIHPYGPHSVARYADDHFVVPDMTQLMVGLGLKTGKALEFEEDGQHEIFSKVMRSSNFSVAVATAIDSSGVLHVGAAGSGISLGLPDSCFAPGSHGATTAKVHPGCQEDASHPVGLKQLAEQLPIKWGTHGRWLLGHGPDGTDAKLRCGGHAVMVTAGFVPVLFNGDGSALLYCSSASNLRVHRVQFKDKLSPVASGSAFVSLGALPLFRKNSAGKVGFDKRLRFGNDTQAAPLAMMCESMRKKLATHVNSAASWIDDNLKLRVGELKLERIEGPTFWEMTTNSIFRRHIAHADQVVRSFPTKTGPPRVREFARINDEPYAPAPKEIAELASLPAAHTHTLRRPSRRYADKLKQLRRIALVRCVHRLVNTRLLRGSLALVGVSPAIYERQDDPQKWTDDEITEWRQMEESALVGALATTAGDDIQQSDSRMHESKEWWLASGHGATGRDDIYQRKEVFPHMSQRAMWSRAALEAATGMMLADSNGNGEGATVVELARDHILEDLVAACTLHFEEAAQAEDGDDEDDE